MKNIPFTISMLVISLMLASKMARAAGAGEFGAQGTVEVMCRGKAKELAMQAYSNCVTEEKASRLSDLKNRYKARMSEVKSDFQRELDELNGKATAGKAAKKAAKTAKAKPAKIEPVKTVKAEKPTAGIATALPAKMNDNGPAEPIQAVSDEQTVIAPTPLEAAVEATEAPASAASTAASPEPEIIDMSEQ